MSNNPPLGTCPAAQAPSISSLPTIRFPSLALVQQFHNVPIQPIPLQFLIRHSLRPRNPPATLFRPAGTLEWLIHLPLGTGVKEGQGITSPQGLVVDDAHLHAGHVEDERGVARVVAEDQVGVQLDVGVAAGLDAGVPLGAGGGAGDWGEDRPRWERDERVGTAAEGFGATVHAQAIGMSREGFGDGDGGRHCNCSLFVWKGFEREKVELMEV